MKRKEVLNKTKVFLSLGKKQVASMLPRVLRLIGLFLLIVFMLALYVSSFIVTGLGVAEKTQEVKDLKKARVEAAKAAESKLPMKPPNVRVMSGWYREGEDEACWRYIEVDGKLAIQGTSRYPVSFVLEYKAGNKNP